MLMRLHPVIATAALLAAQALPAWAAGDQAASMQALAARSGCTSCHLAAHGDKTADGLAPIGPAWQDVAARYRGQKDAEQRLLQTVIAGSNPYASHWKGQVSGLAMPPNAVAIKPAQARRLVRWILAQQAAAKR